MTTTGANAMRTTTETEVTGIGGTEIGMLTGISRIGTVIDIRVIVGIDRTEVYAYLDAYSDSI